MKRWSKIKKFALHPGWIISSFDGQEHYIGAAQLTELYQVDIRECIVIDSSRPETFLGRRNLPDLIHLYPLSSGKYYNAQLRWQKEKEGV